MRCVLGLVAALAFLSISVVPSAAQKEDGAASVLSSSDYIGAWNGVTDWRGVDGYDNPTARWEFLSDGRFVDDEGNSGAWSVGADGYVNFNYPSAGQARYTGTIVGDMLVGTMTTGEYSGAFAARRQSAQ